MDRFSGMCSMSCCYSRITRVLICYLAISLHCKNINGQPAERKEIEQDADTAFESLNRNQRKAAFSYGYPKPRPTSIHKSPYRRPTVFNPQHKPPPAPVNQRHHPDSGMMPPPKTVFQPMWIKKSAKGGMQVVQKKSRKMTFYKGGNYYKKMKNFKMRYKHMYKGKGQRPLPRQFPRIRQPSSPPKLPTDAPIPQGTSAPTEVDCTTSTVCSSECLQVTQLAIVDADQDISGDEPTITYLFFLQNDAAYGLSNLQTAFDAENFAVVCVTSPEPFSSTPFEVGSVGLRDNNFGTHVNATGYNAALNYNIQVNPPYALAGKDSANFFPTELVAGAWSLTCQAFCDMDASGEASEQLTVTFEMIP